MNKAAANKALKKAGYSEQVEFYRPGAYWYFCDGTASSWFGTIIGSAATFRNMTADRLLALRDSFAPPPS